MDYSEDIFSDLPIIGSATDGADSSQFPDFPAAEVSFSGKSESYCVCFIDMMNSTVVTSGLDNDKLARYYSTFLNAMAAIVKNFDAKIIKNAGDCLIYYFPPTSDIKKETAFSNVLDCCAAMIEANKVINARLNSEALPPLNYRISADYGKVEMAHSVASNNDDLFGSTMNLCAKINSKASRNGMVVGGDLYNILISFPSISERFTFKEVASYSVGLKQTYSVYSLLSKQKRNVVNPFRLTSAKS